MVEPNYKNKYPPIGLMKISTYFKNKGDFVEFHKGIMPVREVQTFDKVLITTLFTFDFNMCVNTINYYVEIVGIQNVFVGGIAATIMPEKFKEEIPGIQLLLGQMTSSNVLGYSDNVNVDVLELDYDMLWDTSYNYPAADSYFIYTTRGCPRKCTFCAVKTLEPEFYDCNNITSQVQRVDQRFGIKRDLLIMDNNILYSEHFYDSIDEIKTLGFGVNNNRIKRNNPVKYYLISLRQRVGEKRKYGNLLARINGEIDGIKYTRVCKKDIEFLDRLKQKRDHEKQWVKTLLENEQSITDIFDRYYYHKIARHVDFNQGLDARLFTNQKAKKMAEIAIKPCRIAFDNLATKNDYFKAMDSAVRNGITHFSNYLLYNYNEKPEDLWVRLELNIKFCQKHRDKKISLFSFPMKYASIEHTDRKYVGKYWHKKYLRAINVILNVTSGVVPKEDDLFYRAFGNNLEEYMDILVMPDEFIRFRDFFEEKGLTHIWRKLYHELKADDKATLIDILDGMVDDPESLDYDYGSQINEVLDLYKIKKKKVESNALYYSNFCNRILNRR